MIQEPIPGAAEGEKQMKGDGVHPLAPGAFAMYTQVLADFPEIMDND